ncbi:MAG: response regulator [Reichenbachiella sp.]|uniref:response regulator n=1 Tax=Reichenbachiella sp. TaxID=2184521 RepID=UPI0029666F96|nr:response regulator [Reichenbachiella sp.]MDW3211797.1 response regulator [Reichenbachiella sp.]
MTVLYVDDESIPRIIFDKIFGSKYTTLMAESGPDALEKLAALEDDLTVVITDMRMPGMDGVDFLTEAHKKYNNLACFILTSMSEDDKVNQGVADNLIEKVFQKPLNASEVEAAIEEVVSRVV